APARVVTTNRQWDILPGTSGSDQRALLRDAAQRLGAWRFELAGVPVDGALLAEIAASPADVPLLRAARERLKRPVDLEDLLFFLDDLLAAGEQGLRDQPVWITAPRARDVGIFIHPAEVFGSGGPRRYGADAGTVNIDEPAHPPQLAPAADGEALGPNWSARYPNPEDDARMLAALSEMRPASDFAIRIKKLIDELRVQGADVYLTSTVRRRERGYLMWGAFELSRLERVSDVQQWCEQLGRLNRSWKLNIPIRWFHPDGWRVTIEEGRRMAEAYDVVYATQHGARTSEHYDGVAVDVTAVGLPARLTLIGVDGVRQQFDLSAAHETRDLSLTPQVIAWVEEHLRLRKLKLDYPHWSDAQLDAPR
ncbi:MAG: hypothetical protein AAB426_02025, partial [Myxococcota bacterium]